MKHWTIIATGYLLVATLSGLPGGNKLLGQICGLFAAVTLFPMLTELVDSSEQFQGAVLMTWGAGMSVLVLIWGIPP